MAIVSFSLSHGKPSKEAPSLLGLFNFSLAYVSSSGIGSKLAASNSFTFECHLCSSNVPSANMLVGALLIRSSTYKISRSLGQSLGTFLYRYLTDVESLLLGGTAKM